MSMAAMGACGATAAHRPPSILQARAAAAERGAAAGRGRWQGPGRGVGRTSGGRRPNGIKPVELEQQASFKDPFPDAPVTAIIGGGLAGLTCAQELARCGLQATIFDTGEHGVGGRLATRCSLDGSLKGAPAGLLFDHAAQFFTATDPAFTSMVHRWEADGAVMRWTGPVGMLADGHFVPDDGQGAVRWVARGGMRQLAQYLAGQAHRPGEAARGPSSPGSGTAAALVTVRRPQWISGAQAEPEGWRLVGRGRDQGLFDVAVIAHNGKCANRLAAPMRGAEAVHRQLRRLKLSANWVLMAAFASPVAAPGGLQGAFVSGSQVLGWAANNTAKLGGPAQGGVQCWTLISTQAYGRLNKVPQENVPPEVAQRVTAEMLAAFTRCLGLPEGALPPLVFTQAQLWGAALPTNSPHVPCLFDPSARVGVCGDWVAGGGSMQAAALSGVAMAQRIVAASGQQGDALRGLALGLDVPLRAVQGEQIGQFPGKQAAPAADAHTSAAAQTAAPAGKQPSLGAY